MTASKIGSREQWLTARRALLVKEKELLRQSDEVTRQRMALPWVAIDKPYQFTTEDGQASLKDLFGGRSQLLVYHFMFGPDYKAGCPSCSAIADGFNGTIAHLQNHGVAFWAVSRGPLSKLLAYRERMGWSFPWASSAGSDFNFDFNVSFTQAQQRDGMEYNFAKEAPVIDGPATITSSATSDGARIAAVSTATDVETYARERPGMSAFARQDGTIYHTYSSYARGVDPLWNVYQWLDRAPKGRNETGYWWRRHDEYDAATSAD